MRRATLLAVIRRIISLFSGSPATIANLPPPRSCFAPASVSKRSFVKRLPPSGPWQGKQRSARIGRMVRLKLIGGACASNAEDQQTAAMNGRIIIFLNREYRVLPFLQRRSAGNRDRCSDK